MHINQHAHDGAIKFSVLLVISVCIRTPLLMLPQDQFQPLHIGPQPRILPIPLRTLLPLLLPYHLQLQHFPLPTKHPQQPLCTRKADAGLLRLQSHHVEIFAGVGGVVA